VTQGISEKGGNWYIRMVYLRALLGAIVLRVWLFLDIMVSWYLNSKPLRQDKITTINLRLRRHRGEPVKLDDGSVVNPKDLLIELHLNNTWFLRKRTMMHSPGKTGWEFLSAFSEDLNYLAKQVSEGIFASEIKAIHARTLLRQDQGSQRLGFTVMDLPNTLWRRLSQFYLAGLRQAYYPERARRPIAKAKPLVRKEVWMSKRKLLQSYGPSAGG
jgi:hypothetical protein